MLPLPNSLTKGENPGGTNIIGGRPYRASFVFASSSLPNAKAGEGLTSEAAIRAPVRAKAVCMPEVWKWIRVELHIKSRHRQSWFRSEVRKI